MLVQIDKQVWVNLLHVAHFNQRGINEFTIYITTDTNDYVICTLDYYQPFLDAVNKFNSKY